MPLLDLPNELLQNISENLESEIEINAIAQANRRLYCLLDSYLYRYNIQQSGSSALCWAARYGREATVQKLLREKAKVQVPDDDDAETPLLLAVANGHTQVVKLLLDEGAEVNCDDALQGALAGGYSEIVKLLLNSGASITAYGRPYGNALRAASYGGHEQLVKMLLDQGAEVNDGRYSNALQIASLRGHKEVVKLLIEAGADVNSQSGPHGNALQAASAEGHKEIVKLLLDAGADVKDGIYDNALCAARDGCSEEIIKLLL